MTLTLDQLRRELGLTRAEWRELQYAAVDREIGTRPLLQLIVRAALVRFSIHTPGSVGQSQSKPRSTARKA